MQKIFLALALLAIAVSSCAPAAASPQAAQTIPQPEKEQNVTTRTQNSALRPAETEPAEPGAAPLVCPPCAEAEAAPAAKSGMWPASEGLGIMGDSFYDEYQGSDQRGGRYHETTFNLVEILVHTRDLNIGPWGRRREPRRTGFAYNWARSGATSDSMIEEGQHTGLAEQIRQGKVSYVWIGIGANDFSPYYTDSYRDIYNGTMTGAQVRAKVKRAVENVTLAVDTVLEAGAKGVVVTYFTQWEMDPLLSQGFPDASRRRRVADAIEATNRGIQAMADKRGIYAFNQNSIGERLLPNLVERRYLVLGEQRIDFGENGDPPEYSRLADNQHLGTAMSGLAANWYFIETMNKQFGMDIAPLTEEEILRISGFREE